MSTEYQDRVLAHLTRIAVRDTVPPWRRVGAVIIGGCTDVGFGEESDLLLVASANGTGVFDCLTGAKVARERGDDARDRRDQVGLACPGIGPLAGQQVRMSGLWGGGLQQTTNDRWSLQVVCPTPFERWYFLEPPGADVFNPHRSEDSVRLNWTTSGTPRAAGFSPTGRSLVIVDSSDMLIFSR